MSEDIRIVGPKKASLGEIEILRQQLQAALSRAVQAEAEVVELRSLLEDAVLDLESVAHELAAPEDHKRSPSSFWRSRARYYQDALSSPSPVAEALGRVVEAAEEAAQEWSRSSVVDGNKCAASASRIYEAVDALQAARSGRGEG